jgi:hypothetical protein
MYNSMKKVKIYKLVYDGKPVYIGKTKTSLKVRKQKGYKGTGVEPISNHCEIELIEETLEKGREDFWISEYIKMGFNLLNKRKGITGLDKSDYKKNWYIENKERLKDKQKIYYEENKEYIIKKSVEYAKLNPEIKKKSSKKWRDNNKDKISESNKRWNEKNKDYFKNYNKTYIKERKIDDQ